MNSSVKILKTFAEVQPYLSDIQHFADQNRSSLGFFTKATFEEKAWANKLWVEVDQKTNEVLGYVLFGGVFPSIKIFQLFVSQNKRLQGIGRRLVKHLVEFGESEQYLNISVRVGADLEANHFWENLNFKLVRQQPGGLSSRRTINVRVLDLETPSLLKAMEPKLNIPRTKIRDLRFSVPISRSPIYVLDLNVFFDVAKHRLNRNQAAYIMQAGFSHRISLRITPEFLDELERHSQAKEQDPILEFARTLPTLPRIELNALKHHRNDLQFIVFPNYSSGHKGINRADSDLNHLIYCVHHRVTGFVTRDKAVLRAGEKLKQKYGLEVVSPTDIGDISQTKNILKTSVQAFSGTQRISFVDCEEHERPEVEQFLESLGADFKVYWFSGNWTYTSFS